MIQYLNVFFYDIYPYICATVFFLGSWLRYDYGQYTWRASSSQMLDKRGMVIWSNLFHIGILGIFFGHLFGMLTPHWMYAWFLPVAAKQLMAMVLPLNHFAAILPVLFSPPIILAKRKCSLSPAS